MDEAEAAVERHGDGHARFGDGVHVRRNDRDVQLQTVGERGVELRVARQDFRIQRGERDVVERQADFAVRREKFIRRLVERIVEVGIARRCHVRKCRLPDRFGKQNLAHVFKMLSECARPRAQQLPPPVPTENNETLSFRRASLWPGMATLRILMRRPNPDSRPDVSRATPTRSPRCLRASEISVSSRVHGWPFRRRRRAGAGRRGGAVFQSPGFFCR